jgi:hypothetical protein
MLCTTARVVPNDDGKPNDHLIPFGLRVYAQKPHPAYCCERALRLSDGEQRVGV